MTALHLYEIGNQLFSLRNYKKTKFLLFTNKIATIKNMADKHPVNAGMSHAVHSNKCVSFSSLFLPFKKPHDASYAKAINGEK